MLIKKNLLNSSSDAKNWPMHRLFENIVEDNKDRVAVICENKQITYELLNQRANQLASYLKKNKVMPETLVGICVPRGLDLIIGLFGILKCGGAYLPLDPEYPKDRLEYMLEDAGVDILLTTTNLKERFSGYKGQLICLDEEEYIKEPIVNLHTKILPDNLAYVIYTSGSTGRQKGVLCRHVSFTNRLLWDNAKFKLNKDEICCLQSNSAFVDSTWDIFGSVINASKLILYNVAISKDLVKLVKIWFLYGVSRVTITPSMLSNIVELLCKGYIVKKNITHIKHFKVTGERFNFKALADFKIFFDPEVFLGDCYGATEATSVIYRDFRDLKNNKKTTHLLANTQIHILDDHLNRVPIGSIGEIYIGGVGLARGYLNRPSLTAEKFIPNPFVNSKTEEGSRLYKTGDLGRYLADGNIEFLGRIDHQVKIRGFRIELGEIESTLQSVEEIKQCVVLAREDIKDQKKLVGYIVLNDDVQQKESEIISKCRQVCKTKLPDYMQPSQIVTLDAMPLTSNGKVDRKALPAPEGREGIDIYEEPKGLLEEQLAKTWKETLKIETIGRNDNFFDLGGHSLLATQLISRIRSNQKIEVPIRVIFERPVLKDLAKEIEQEYFNKGLLPPIYRLSKERQVPLSFAQQRLWFLEQLLPNLGLYHMPMVLRIAGGLNKSALVKALNAIVKKHEVLRTKIVTIDGIAHQEVLDTGFNLRIERIEQKKELLERIEEETKKTFNFNEEPLFRGLLLELSDNEYILILTFHHIISDEWSMGIFNRELGICYEAYVGNQTPKLKELAVQYKDYSLWQREWLQKEVLNKQLSYWKEKLDKAPSLVLPSKPRPAEQNYSGKYYEGRLSKQSLDKLNKLAKESGVTLFMMLLASFKGMLTKVCAQDDVVIGTPIANRRISEIEGLIGFFVNTLVLRTDCSNNPTVKELVNRVEKTSLEAYEHQDVPFEQLVDYLNIPRDLSRQPLFQVMFMLQNVEDDQLRLDNLKLTHIDRNKRLSKFDLTLNVIKKEDGLYIGYEYAADLFDEKYMARLNSYFIRFIEQAINDPKLHISEIQILDKAELKQLDNWNATKQKHPRNKCVHELFEGIIEDNKDRVAVICENKQITYELLNQRANQLASYLKKNKVMPETLVGICVPRGLDLIIGLFGILKSGGAYLPLDPEYPKDRLEYMLEDAGVDILLTTINLKEQFSGYKGQLICLDEEEYIKEPTVNLHTKILPDNLAYVIYTSGSTGKPKGVGIKHCNLFSYLSWAKGFYSDNNNDPVLLHGSSAFDMAVTSIYVPLINAQHVEILHGDFSEKAIFNSRKHGKKSFLKLTPSHFLMLRSYSDINLSQVAHAFVVGGDALSKDNINNLKKEMQFIRIYNEYGPTETTVASAVYEIDKEYEYENDIPIGSPIPNTQIHILDDHLNRVPIGSIGEIYIGGVGLARGYLNSPSLTAEKFIPNPFVNNKSDEGSRLYKTGDLGRYLADGNIEFLGRIDHQVKIRGFRIELGEIESTLQSVAGIKQCVVLAREDIKDQKKLVSYIVLDANAAQKESEIISKCREACKTKLPDYMQPSQIVTLDAMPLTPNGKVDRKSLPAPEGREGIDIYEEPKGLLEEQLVNIWKETLKIEKIGRNDNFFSLGGDSIVSIQIVSRARQKGILFDVREIFKNPTIAALAVNSKKTDRLKTEEVLVAGNAPLLPIQQWFFKKVNDVNHFNQAFWFIPKEIEVCINTDINELKSILTKIYKHHDILRIKFRRSNDEWKQYYDKEGPIPFEVITRTNWSKDNLDDICSKIQSSLDIEKGPLSRLVWFEGRGLFWVIHHLIVDGVSWRILLDDLNALYCGNKLPPKSSSYKGWGEFLQKYETPKNVKAYYKNIPNTILQLEQEEDKNKVNSSVVIFSKKISKTFIQKAQKSYRTQANDLLLTALVQAVGKYSGYELSIELEGHGRESLGGDIDLTRSVGWFTSLYPVHLKLSDPSNIDKSIKAIKEQLRQVPDNGITYGIARIKSQVPATSSNIVFNYLGQWDSVDIKGNTFRLSSESIGNTSSKSNKLTHNIAINGQVKDGILSFVWTSSYQENVIKEIAEDFKEKLENLISHCLKEGMHRYTPSDFELAEINQNEIDAAFHDKELDTIYPLSPIQDGLLFQALYQPKSEIYFVQSVFKLINLNVASWRRAWNIVINRHDSLRAGFMWQGIRKPHQVIYKEVEPDWIEEVWDKCTNQKLKLQNLMQAERRAGFKLDKAPLIRFNLVKLDDVNSDSEHYFIWNIHHLLVDGWSVAIIFDEVLDVYKALASNEEIKLEARREYRDYISWLLSQKQNKSRRYWEESLSGVIPTKLIGDKQLSEEVGYGERELILDKKETEQLNRYAKALGITDNTVLQGIWGILLSKYTNQDDVVFGVTVSGRNIGLSGIENMVGIFINTLPIRMRFKSGETIADLFKRLQMHTSKAQAHGHIALADIQSLQKSGSLFDNIYVFENYPTSNRVCDKNVDGNELSVQPIETIEKTEYGLSVVVMPGKEIKIRLSYDKKYFTEESINKLSKHLGELTRNIVQNKYQYVGVISLISAAELKQLNNWNATKREYPENKCVHELFEDIVEDNKDRVAVICEDKQITYELLNQRANQLASHLKKNKVTPETLVGMCIPRGLDLIIGLFGILKSGGAYLPLDPEYPKDRLEYMLEDASADILLTTTNLKKQFSEYKGKLICLDEEGYIKEPAVNLHTEILPDNLAYVIYTSGSTGKPKGVMIRHSSIINLTCAQKKKFNCSKDNRILQFASFSFDASVAEWANTLTEGDSLVLYKFKELDMLPATVIRNHINCMTLTSSALRAILPFNYKGTLVVAGEKTSSDLLKQHQNGQVKILNAYGPTENTVCASIGKITHINHIGTAIQNTQIHILDEYLNQVPIGSIGEIYIGGVGLARGYLNRPSLTAEKFIPNPFVNSKTEEGSRLYKTGDLGRYLADGNIEFLGRIDHQVKIRGFRIELGEIESTLQSVAGIKQCVVLAREDIKDQKKLVGYIVLNDDVEQKESEIISKCREACKTKLPDYMQPSQIVTLDAMPLTPNGKVDRKSLPAPEGREGIDIYEQPKGLLEEQLANIWKETLKIETIGRNDNFFSLGVNSLLTVQMLSRARQKGMMLNVKQIFENPTIASLAAICSKQNRNND